MRDLAEFLDEAFVGQERVSRDEVYRRAVAARLPAEIVQALDGVPEGEYAQYEIMDALQGTGDGVTEAGVGVRAIELDEEDLLRELGDIHRARHGTLRHGSDHALATHTERMAELEGEYLRRFPGREIDPQAAALGRSGANCRNGNRSVLSWTVWPHRVGVGCRGDREYVVAGQRPAGEGLWMRLTMAGALPQQPSSISEAGRMLAVLLSLTDADVQSRENPAMFHGGLCQCRASRRPGDDHRSACRRRRRHVCDGGRQPRPHAQRRWAPRRFPEPTQVGGRAWR